MIDLGNHLGRLEDLTGRAEASQVPVAFFELREGGFVLEQLRVVDFFLQEYRNRVSEVPSTVSNLSFLLDKLNQRPELKAKIAEKLVEANQKLALVDRMTAEVAELLAVLEPAVLTLQHGGAKLLPAADREQREADLRSQAERLQGELAPLEAVPFAEVLDEQRQQITHLRAQLNEIRQELSYYQLPAAETFRQQRIAAEANLNSARARLAVATSPELLAEIQLWEDQLATLIAPTDDYDGYVQRVRQQPVLPYPTHQMIHFSGELRRQLENYRGPLTEPNQRPFRDRLQDLVTQAQQQIAGQ